MKFNKLLICATASALWVAPAVQAAEINWNGFMSIGAGTTLDSDTTYVVEPTTGGTYDDEVRFAPESVVGLQAQTVISDDLRATVQMVAKGGADFDTVVDWAYVSYDFNDSLTLNAGRFRLPLYYYSDFLDVGYAYHWIRPPVELYSAPTSQLEGVNLYHTMFVGDVEVATQAWYGGIEETQQLDGIDSTFDSTNNMGVNTLLTWEWFKLRLLYNTTDMASAVSGEIPGLGAFSSESDMETTFTAAGFFVDYENFIWRSEITQSDTTSATAANEFGPASVMEYKDTAWYMSAGYRIGDFTPHITRAEIDPEAGSYSVPTETNTVGVAWAFHPSATFKLEYLQTEQEASAFAPGTDVDVVSASLDLVF